MARTDTLGHFLTDVADAIRTKKGSSDTIQASDFDTEIANLPSGGGIDWSAIGYDEQPSFITDGYDYAEEIYNNWSSTPQASFYGDNNLVFFPSVEISGLSSMYTYFGDCKNLLFAKVKTTSAVTSCNGVFSGCNSLKGVDLSEFDTSNVTNMQDMFIRCTTIKEIDFSGANTSKLMYLQNFCQYCSNLEKVKFDNWDTSKVTNFGGMFSNCQKLKEVDISSFTNESATNIKNMFEYCSVIEKIDMRNMTPSTISGSNTGLFNTIKVDCLIIVKDNTEKAWMQNKYPSFTNIKTVAEYEAE